MGKSTIVDKIRDCVSGVLFKCFLRISQQTQEEYFRSVVKYSPTKDLIKAIDISGAWHPTVTEKMVKNGIQSNQRKG